MRARAPLLGALLLLGAVSCAIVRAGEGGFLADLLGERLKSGLGLISGDFVEFSLRRVRMRNVKMVAPNVKPTDEHVFLRVREVTVDFTPMEVLWKGSVRRVEIDGPEVWLGEIAAGGSETSSGGGRQLSIGELVVKDITLHVDNLTDRGPSVLLRFATDQPLVVPDVRLGDLANNPQADVAQELRSHKVLVSSGFGPMAPLGSVETVVIRFSWSGLAAGHVAGLELVQPVLFVGQDWFDLIGELQASDPKPLAEPGGVAAATDAAVTTGDRAMALDTLRIDGLRLALTSFGIVDVMLPFTFDYAAANVVLDTSGDFLLESTLSVRRTDWALPERQLFVEGLQGELAFNLPPDGNRDNVVPTFTAERLTWQDVRATEPWASITIMPSAPASEEQAKTATAVAAVDVQFGAQLGASYLKGWVGSNLAFEWQATFDVWRTGAGPAEPFARLGLPKVAGLYAKASGASSEVAAAEMTLVSEQKKEVVLDAGGDISAFVQENLGVAPSAEELERAAIAEVATRQRLRWGQIQDLKNQRLVGEAADGFLVARVPDLDAAWRGATTLVHDENGDRLRIYQFVAKHDRKPLAEVQRAYAERWRLLAFPGEWVQTPEGVWFQK
jgi:uncharacterized protein YdbL (DUF1318 family)